MAAKSISDLQELLAALGRERSLRGRLRVLGHAWQLLRELAPGEREQVALRIGSDWAWKRVEKSFLRDGDLDENEAKIGRIFERIGDSDPQELRAMASALRSGDRDAAKDMLLMTLEEALEDEAAEDEAAARVAEAAAPPADAAELFELAEAAVTGEIVETLDGVLAASRASRVEPVAPAPAEVVADARASAPASPAPVLPPAPPPVRAAAPVAVLPTSDFAPPAALALAGDEYHELVLRPAATGGRERLRLLRALNAEAAPGAELGPEGRQGLVAKLGGGWASRRAVSSMIRARSLSGLDEALGLIRRLERNGQRVWCLADLIEHWELDASARERVLAAAPTTAARRRLAGRARG